MSIYENTQMGITEGTILLVEYINGVTGATNPTVWQYLDHIVHPTRIKPKIVVTPKSKIAGFTAWVEDVALSVAHPIQWRFKISYSGGVLSGDGTEGDNIGFVATSTWN